MNSSKINGLDHAPKKWAYDSIRKNTNCYTYALDLRKNPITNKFFKDWDHIQPGNICDRQHKSIYFSQFLQKHNEYKIKKFIKYVREDCKYLKYQIRKSSLIEKRNGGWWKVVLYFELGDYHWYRQNNDGTWSHKIGSQKVSNKDKNGEIITNPEKCNRGYYNKFIGYFLIRKIL